MDSLELQETFKAKLRANGQRFTPERATILEAVLSSREHFSAEKLALELKKRKERVSLATIYRTLPMLVECGFLKITVKQGDVEYFERKLEEDPHHDHLLCVSCGRIVEFCNAVIEEEQEKTASEFGFELLDHAHVLRGRCGQCRTTPHRPLFS